MRKVIALLVTTFVLALLAITYLALQSSGVVIVETAKSLDQPCRFTHTWFVTDGNQILLEAGHPDNPWVQDLADVEYITINGEGIAGRYRFSILNTEVNHKTIRELMRSKYGWRDWWVDLLFDTSQSRMIKLTHVPSS